MKNVLLLTTTPTVGGNGDVLIAAAMEEAKEHGAKVQLIHIREKQIGFCRACYGCAMTGVCVQKEGKVRAIGLSNFTAAQIQEILDICEVKPAILQTEVHPYSQEQELKEFLAKENMVIQAWYPLGHGDKALIQEPVFSKLAEKYGKSNAQIILRWHIQVGNVVIPGSKNPDHIRANFELFDFSMDEVEMAEIAALNKDKRYYTSTPELLERYAAMVPPVDEQK